MAARFVLVLAFAASPAAAPAPDATFAVDLAHTPFRTMGGVESFAATARVATMQVRLLGSMGPGPRKAGEILFALHGMPLPAQSWNDWARVSAELRVPASFVGDRRRNWQRPHRARLFVEDAGGRRLYLPSRAIVDRPAATEGWMALGGTVTVDVPVPLGFVDDGFDPSRVTGLGVNVEAFDREGESVTGAVELRDLRVTFGPVARGRVLPVDPVVTAGEAARAAVMDARLRQHLPAGGMAVGVNLPWPSVGAPDGRTMQLYGRLLDAGPAIWWGRRWDLGDEAVAAAVRADFHDIRRTFGPGAVVRVWLLGDGRTALAFTGAGAFRGVTDRARANLPVLMRLAADEQVLLIPVLLDFAIADGVAASGPDGTWPVGEHPELITSPGERSRLVAALEAFVRPFAADPSVLAWDVMNEPGNAAAVVTPERFADLQELVRDLIDAVHRAGGLATVGHRNAVDPVRWWRGRVADDLGQAHYYPLVETRLNPTPFGVSMARAFGPLPAGWGELAARPGEIAARLDAARRAGDRLFLFWSWHGHEDTGDGYAVAPYADEIQRAVATLRAGGVPGNLPSAAAPRR